MTRRDDVAVATVLGLALLGVLTAVAVAGMGLGALLVAHRRAQAAADLGAVAAAAALQRGDDACAAAARITALNGARLAGCHVQGQDVRVDARCEALAALGIPLSTEGAARAGPVDPGLTDLGPRPP